MCCEKRMGTVQMRRGVRNDPKERDQTGRERERERERERKREGCAFFNVCACSECKSI